jgi:heat shock protein HtpX
VHPELIARNRRTSIALLVANTILVGVAAAGAALILQVPVGPGLIIAAVVGIVVTTVAALLSNSAAQALTGAVEVTPEQATMLHNVVEGLCLAAGLPKPRVYIIDDPGPNACAFGRSPKTAGIAVTSGLLELCSRRELEGVVAHELSHVANRDTAVMTLAVTSVGVVVLIADVFARVAIFSGGDEDEGPLALLGLVTVLLAPLGAWLLMLAVSRHREELADGSAVDFTRNPSGLRKALEKLEADTVTMRHASRATSHLWIESPLERGGRQEKMNRAFDTHPPIAERIAILRKLEGLDPDGRGPVDATAAGVPVDLAALRAAADARTSTPPRGRGVGPTDAPPPAGSDASAPPAVRDVAPGIQRSAAGEHGSQGPRHLPS